jgi:branched-chain amino acid transport system substrate-binding protein
VVGDDLHPIGQVKDFAPFVAKIKASGADSVVTGNWGADLTLLVKAAKEAGLNANLYTYYAGVSGTPTALAAGVGGNVRQVAYIHNSLPGVVQQIQNDFKKRFNDDWYTGATYNGMALLTAAMAKAKSTDPVNVAAAMSGLRFTGFQGDVEMRKSDHQLQQALFISEWRKADAKNPYSVENTGFNFQEVKAIPAYVASTPTSCQMKRP